jgi:hypothetical protein
MKKKKLSSRLSINKQTIASLEDVRGGQDRNPTFQAVSGDPCVLQSGCGCNPTFQAVSGDPCVLQTGCGCTETDCHTICPIPC